MNSTSLLHFAAGYGKLNIVKFLIKKRININYISNDGTALIRAAKFSHYNIVKFLLSNGAEIYHTDNNGFDAISHATQFNHVNILQLLFIFIISNTNTNTTTTNNGGTLLPPDASFSSNTTNCLDIGISSNDNLINQFSIIDSFQLNKIHNYLISFNNSDIPSPIHLACQWGSLSALQFILSLYSIDENKSLSLLVNLLSKNKQTPLMLCCKYGHLECCELLINKHADINAVDNDGYNILKIAKIWSRDRIIDYITPLFENYTEVKLD
jgi:ankyrin repeat protein